MKKLINIVSYIPVLGVIYTAIINASEILTLKLSAADSEPALNLNLAIYTLIVLVVGLFAGICQIGQFYLTQKEKLNAYKRELEKSSVTNSTSTSRVEVLEAKIATLEKALNDALNK